MKTKKSVLLLSLIFLGVLPSGYGIEPWEVINAYFNLVRNWNNVAGNVISYKNKFNQTIILTSGEYFSVMPPPAELGPVAQQQCIIIPLEDIVGLITNKDEFLKNTYKLEPAPPPGLNKITQDAKELSFVYTKVSDFSGICSQGNDAWNRHVAESPFSLQPILKQYRHTEIQVQALYNTFVALNNKVDKSEDETTSMNKLEALLPVILVPDDRRLHVDAGTPLVNDLNVYSLFEACHACEKTAWLNQPGRALKGNFYFRVLDRQYTFSGKYKVKDEYPEMAEHPRGFMSQFHLEEEIYIGGISFKAAVQGPNHMYIPDGFLEWQNFTTLQDRRPQAQPLRRPRSQPVRFQAQPLRRPRAQ